MLELRVSCRLSPLASPAPLSHISPLFSFSSPSYLLSLSSILSPLASDHSPVSSRLSLLSVESFANYHSLATIQNEWYVLLYNIFYFLANLYNSECIDVDIRS